MDCSCHSAFKTTRVFVDKDFKTAISMRDGFQVYHGSEIGLQDRSYKIFRSSDAIIKVFKDLKNLPVTIDHVDPEKPIDESRIVGKIKSSKIVDSKGDDDSQIAVENILDLTDDALQAIEDGRKELSLGYLCKTRDHKNYDLEQYDIKPHHLAIVKSGRCGDICSVLDSQVKGEEMRLDSFIDGLDNIVRRFKDSEEEEKAEVVEDEEEEEVVEDEEEEEKPKKEAAKTDAAFTKKMVDAEVKKTLSIIDKASSFLPSSYVFSESSNNKIMLDAIRTVHPDIKLSRHELETAFKMLDSSSSKHKSFGDSYMNKKDNSGVMSLFGQSITGE